MRDAGAAADRSADERTEIKTMRWMMQFTKDCPRCGVAIEKNLGAWCSRCSVGKRLNDDDDDDDDMAGCNHMTCRGTNCKHEFCWVCMASWTGAHYNCTGATAAARCGDDLSRPSQPRRPRRIANSTSALPTCR